MARWKVSTVDKKSVQEIATWTKDGKELEIQTGFRWGSWIVETSDDNPPVFEFDGDGIIDMYDYYKGNIVSIELDCLDDGCWLEWEFSDNISEEEQEEIIEGWDEDSYDYLESNDWLEGDTQCQVFCELSIERLEDRQEEAQSYSSESNDGWNDKSIEPSELGEYEVLKNAPWPLGGLTKAYWDGNSWLDDNEKIDIHKWKNN